jgi:hypothetical protein
VDYRHIFAGPGVFTQKMKPTGLFHTSYVRGVSLQHWLNFDRNTMFEESTEASPVKP